MLLESQNECQGLKEEMKKLRQNLTLDEGKELSKDSAVFKVSDDVIIRARI